MQNVYEIYIYLYLRCIYFSNASDEAHFNYFIYC